MMYFVHIPPSVCPLLSFHWFPSHKIPHFAFMSYTHTHTHTHTQTHTHE
jgi:hypothetical protein